MTEPCARCNDDSTSEVYTLTGTLHLCADCADAWMAMQLGAPIEAMYSDQLLTTG